MNHVKKCGKDLYVTIPDTWSKQTVEELLKNVWHLSKKTVHFLRINKAVEIAGQPVPFSTTLEQGMELIIRGAFTEQEVDYVPVNKSVEILFEDDFILIANKPAGISTHPNEKGKTDTLMNRLVAYLKQKGEPVYIKHIQRLDKDTTGAVLFAKSALVGTMLDHALTRREIKRTYLAIVHGKLNKQKGTIDAKIGRDRHHPTRRRVSPTGQEAVTHYEVVNYNGEKNISTVMCQLDTGRTHQIRVHLSDLGHPLVGDQLYGGKKDFYRQALHAIQLDFTHPLTLKKMSIRAPFVDDLHIFTKNH